MAEKKLLCPLRAIYPPKVVIVPRESAPEELESIKGYYRGMTDCVEEGCAWWLPAKEHCAVRGMAESQARAAMAALEITNPLRAVQPPFPSQAPSAPQSPAADAQDSPQESQGA